MDINGIVEYRDQIKMLANSNTTVWKLITDEGSEYSSSPITQADYANILVNFNVILSGIGAILEEVG